MARCFYSGDDIRAIAYKRKGRTCKYSNGERGKDEFEMVTLKLRKKYRIALHFWSFAVKIYLKISVNFQLISAYLSEAEFPHRYICQKLKKKNYRRKMYDFDIPSVFVVDFFTQLVPQPKTQTSLVNNQSHK